MKSITKKLLSMILILGMVVTTLQFGHLIKADTTEENPMRALWLRPKETSKAQVEAAVQKIADAGINTIFLETVFNGYTIFPVDYDATYQNPDYRGFDVLKAYIDACHSRGIQLHCWVESFFIGMEWEDAGGPVYAAHKDWLLTDKNGNNWEDTIYGKMYFFNPARKECRDWIVNLYAILVSNYDIDGIQLDYVRYPEKTGTKDYGFDEYTITKFVAEYGFDPTNAKEGSYEAEVFVTFKQQQVTEFVKACSDTLREIKPELILSLSVYPFFDQGKSNFMQSAELWMDKGYGDLVVPMAYYENQVERLTQDAIAVAGGSVKNTVIGLSSQNGFTVDSLERQTDTVLKKGAGVAFFEYESFFQGGYANELKNGALKDTQFHIDPKIYASNVSGDKEDGQKGYLHRANSYDYDMGYTKDICVFASPNETDNVLTITGEKAETFGWWYNFALEFNEQKGTWTVTAADMTINDQNVTQTYKLGKNKMVVMFHGDVKTTQRESYEFFTKTVHVGREYWLVGDIDVISSGNGKLDGVYFTTVDPNPEVTPDPEPSESEKPEPSESEKPEPSESEKPEPSESEKPEPSESEKPKPSESEKPEPSESEKPEPSESEKPEPSESEKPEPSESEKPEPSESEEPESTEVDTQPVTEDGTESEMPGNTENATEDKTGADEESGPDMIPVVIGVAVVVAAGGAGAVWFFKKKSQTN